MKRLSVILVAAALILSACGASGATVATVNGIEITVGDIEAMIDSEESAIPKEEFAQFLGFEIQREIVTMAAMEDWGIDIAEEEITAEADRLVESSVSGGESREEFLSSRGVTEEFLRRFAHQRLLEEAIRVELTDEVEDPTADEIAEEMGVAEASLTEVCVSHILVSTEEEARQVMARLEAGEEFGALAQELSQDPGTAGNNGILPCSPASQYVPEFRDASIVAPVGEVYEEVVQTAFGFHVMLVTDRVPPTEADLPTEQEITEGLRADRVSVELNNWFLERVTAAEVTVDEDYGTWQAVPTPTVVPPGT